ncbi:NOB1 family endonuclease [Archaeoglobus sp.]
MAIHVIDTSTIFMRKAFYENMVTIPEVVDEVKDENSQLYFSLLNLRVEEASDKNVEMVVRVAKKTGDIHKLSKTDIKLIAKALDIREKGEDVVLVTDDYSIQNVAMSLGLKVDNVVQPKISKHFRWVKVCRGCGRTVEGDVCPICGSEATIKRVRR